MFWLWVLAALPACAQDCAIGSAASYAVGLPAPGSIATAYCSGIGIDRSAIAEGFPLPRELAGVRVTVAGLAAPLYAVIDQRVPQINFQVPLGAAGDPVEVVVEKGGSRAARVVPRLDSPGDFFLAFGLAAMQHASDYGLVTSYRPLHPGDVAIAYLTGLHGTSPRVPDGEAAPFSPLATVPQFAQVAMSDTVRIRFAGTAVTPLFVGLAPGLAGVYQINFVVPVFPPGPVAEVVLVRETCLAFFGSCQAGGGIRKTQRSQPAQVPVAR